MNALPPGAQPGLQPGSVSSSQPFCYRLSASRGCACHDWFASSRVFRQKLVGDLSDSESWGLPGTVCHPDGSQLGPTGLGSDLRGVWWAGFPMAVGSFQGLGKCSSWPLSRPHSPRK